MAAKPSIQDFFANLSEIVEDVELGDTATILRKEKSSDGFGHQVGDYLPLETKYPCKVKRDGKGFDKTEAGSLMAQQVFLVELPLDADIQMDDRIEIDTIPGVRFAVVSDVLRLSTDTKLPVWVKRVPQNAVT